MLQTKPYDDGQIVSFKLVNGDEIVAKVTSTMLTGWTVTKPCTVIPSPQGLALVQSLFGADINKDIELSKQHVMFHAPVVSQLEDHYIQTTTGIKTVSKGPIIV